MHVYLFLVVLVHLRHPPTRYQPELQHKSLNSKLGLKFNLLQRCPWFNCSASARKPNRVLRLAGQLRHKRLALSWGHQRQTRTKVQIIWSTRQQHFDKSCQDNIKEDQDDTKLGSYHELLQRSEGKVDLNWHQFQNFWSI